MVTMTELALKLIMVWLLVGPPALCRGGVLEECCAHDEARVVTAVVADQPPCCKGSSKCSSKRPAEPPAPRKCGTCAGVCATVVKPSDDTVTDTVLMLMPVYLDGVSIDPSILRSQDLTDGRPPELRVPMGELPLLI